MTNEEKEKVICSWIDPEERVTVDFLDALDLSAEVTGCTDQLVNLSIETHVPYMTQHISVPLNQTHVKISPIIPEIPSDLFNDNGGSWLSMRSDHPSSTDEYGSGP